MCLTGIQRPARLSPVTRPRCAAAKASSAANNGAGLYGGLRQTADCPLALMHLYSVSLPPPPPPSASVSLSLCFSISHTNILVYLQTLMVCWREGKVTAPYFGRYTHSCDALCLLLSSTPSVSADPSPHLPHPSIHPSLPHSLLTRDPLHQPLSLMLSPYSALTV